MTKTSPRQILAALATQAGAELIWADMRSGAFHVRRGREVFLGFTWKGATAAHMADTVTDTLRNGQPLHATVGSAYYIPELDARVVARFFNA